MRNNLSSFINPPLSRDKPPGLSPPPPGHRPKSVNFITLLQPYRRKTETPRTRRAPREKGREQACLVGGFQETEIPGSLPIESGLNAVLGHFVGGHESP